MKRRRVPQALGGGLLARKAASARERCSTPQKAVGGDIEQQGVI